MECPHLVENISSGFESVSLLTEWEMNNVLLFLLVVLGFVAVFVFLIKFLSNVTEKKEQNLFKELATVSGFQYCEGNGLGLKHKIEGMFDFGLSKVPIRRMVRGKISNNNIYFFEIDDEAISTGLKDRITPTWSVCLIELCRPVDLGFMYFHRKIAFGKLKKYKSFPQSWRNVAISNPYLKNYTVMSTHPERCVEIMDKGVTNTFSRCAKTFRGKLLPRTLTLQMNGDFIAVYGDQCNFSTTDEFMRSYECARNVLGLLETSVLSRK